MTIPDTGPAEPSDVTAALLPMGQGTPMFYDQAILIQWLKEWDGRPARLFCFIRYGRDARATLKTQNPKPTPYPPSAFPALK